MLKATDKNKFAELRIRAQAVLASKPEKTDAYQEDIKKLVHELDTYQIELELQNEELRNVQEELEKSRDRYADLYDFAPVAYITVSEKGLILEANLTAGRMLGITRGQLIRRPFSDFIVPDNQDVFYLHRKQLLETRQQQSYDLRLQKKDGSLFHALVETVITSESGVLPGQFRIMINDISSRREAELIKIRQIKERYRAIVMDQNELICRFDPQGKLTFVNDAYCRYFGVDYWNVLGTTFLPYIHTDDLPLVEDYFKNLTRIQPEQTIEYRVVLDEKTYWQQCCGRALYDLEGKVFEYQAVGRDITKLKEVEKQLQSELRMRQLFMDALPCVALLMRYNSREIVASNKAAIAIGAVPGHKCYPTWAKRDSPCTWCLAPKLWKSGEAQNIQFWDKGIYWDAYWIPVDDDLYLHYAFDSTEKQKVKEALKQAHDELEQRVTERTLELKRSHEQLLHSEKLAAVGKFSASIAHEFNNPLQSVMTIIKGIGQYVSLEKKEEELVDLALQECHRMKNLIIDLSDFFQPTSGTHTQVYIHDILDALLLISKKDFHTHDITIIKKYADNIPPILAVTDQLKQVFLNLLINAASACENGGVITVATETFSGKSIAVHIEDNGRGISSANITHIFEPFFTTKPNLKGTGLGLSVSYGIIKKHGGHIDVESEPGKGSIFSVFLPIESINNEQ
jgi:PAS domain S-box-containing protein